LQGVEKEQMDSQILPASEAEGHRPLVTSHESPVTPCKSFSFTQFRKNASATPLVSYTFKTTIRPGMVVLSEHREPKDPSESCKLFRLIHFRKNGPANPLVSHTFKTKDLKPFRFTHLQKKGGWRGPGHRCPARKRGGTFQPPTSYLQPPFFPKSFRFCTYVKTGT
jgi:hypothetical protein